jgi:GMP synthase-like glutamine amidotransferase
VRALAIVHETDTGPGVFGDALSAEGWQVDTWLIAEEPEAPENPAGYDAVLSFGGAQNADEVDRYPWLRTETEALRDLLAAGTPLLGVCLGAQLVCEAAAGAVRRAVTPEIGWYQVSVTPAGARDPVIGPLGERFDALQWHSYECRLPDHATPLASSPACVQAYRIGAAAWGIQFHAEVTLADYESWIAQHGGDAEIAPRAAELRAQTQARIGDWNALGRGLCARFLAQAAARRRPRP